ncbi:hypothetical protein [Streptomyces sp. NPDC005795]|uniref:hypothetical protein n=1 Tax=Streptomyces sp. NPDC005795 TaxID=3154677 RepID=UPI0033FDF3A1
MSINEWVKVREIVAARAAAAGFPGLLPCALGTDCRGKNRAQAFSKGGVPFYDPNFTEVVEVAEVSRRAKVTIGAARDARYTLSCRACTQWFHQREMWRDADEM